MLHEEGQEDQRGIWTQSRMSAEGFSVEPCGEVHAPNTKATSWNSRVTQRHRAPYIFLISGYILSPNLKYTVEINSGAAEDAVGPIYYRKNLVCHSFQLGELPHCSPAQPYMHTPSGRWSVSGDV